MQRLPRCLGVVIVALLTLALVPLGAEAAKPLVTVSGGGTASFDLDPALTSQFAIGAVIRPNGSVDGQFVCMITRVVTISGDIKTGQLNNDGSVTFSGVAHGIEHPGGPFKNCEFTVTLWKGGPGVGKFLYSDCVVLPPGDAETVVVGQIKIKP